MQHMATHNMGFLVPLIVSLLSIAGGGGGRNVRLADAAKTTAPNSESPMAYWEAVLPGVPLPPAISDLLAQQNVVVFKDHDVTISSNNLKFINGLRKMGPSTEELQSEPDHGDLKEISVSYGSQNKEDPKNVGLLLEPKVRKDLKKPSMSHESLLKVEVEKTFTTNKAKTEENLKEISVSYGLEGEMGTNKVSPKQENLREISVSYGSKGAENLKEISVSYGLVGEKDLKEISVSYGLEGEKDLKEISVSYGVDGGESVKEISMSYGVDRNKNPAEGKVSYGTEQEGNLKEISVSYGSADGKDEHNEVTNQGEEDPSKVTMSYGSEQEDDPKKLTMSYGSEQEEDPHKVTITYGSQHEDDRKTVSTGSHEAHIAVIGHQGSHHHHAHNHINKRAQADVFFFHDTLRPGSIMTPTIPPTTSLPALLPRRVADSIPFSIRRLSDIMAMFAPASLRMTREIQWTLDTCEQTQTLPGQKSGCATSLESLTKLAASLLRTSHIRAFSAEDLPVEAPGTRALRGRYNVTAVRKVSGQSLQIVTCHDLTYPYAVYFCHTANPTSAYSVTLVNVDDGVAPATMEALAVCHLDTSKWNPKNPFFELHNLKPGEVTVCHFLTKLSIIWVPDGEQGDTHATAR